MDLIKMNTVKFGSLIILLNFAVAFSCLIGIIFAKIYSFILVLALVYAVTQNLRLIYYKHLNFLFITKNKIKHGEKEYDWDNVYITTFLPYLPYLGNFYSFVFSNRYVTKAEAKEV
ncbi:hypothetical protein EOM82_09460, partial [bacterium]|nr:hypothetical protein [bacterium]